MSEIEAVAKLVFQAEISIERQKPGAVHEDSDGITLKAFQRLPVLPSHHRPRVPRSGGKNCAHRGAWSACRTSARAAVCSPQRAQSINLGHLCHLHGCVEGRSYGGMANSIWISEDALESLGVQAENCHRGGATAESPHQDNAQWSCGGRAT